ncbi:helix-turn-helix domain-containing protein [Enterococcus wangshanyuanii]|uniref:Transcriptional regulator n=1 Tax=Enterococcus wangshanyuanii TaxID=2005703 RepID=A0ABQ1PWT8_9ENTE|nr:helix-turn-helix transcriptional regulator [Enterococcus wangshanyuanii]GGD06109.1 transcriptional regulator [Enterococcus wangshanyuanii]
MNLFDRVSQLSKKQGLSLVELAEKLDLSRHAFYSWKTSSPKAETLQKVAEYFEVSTDYLLGRTDNPNVTTNDSSMAKQVMMRMDTDGLSKTEIDEIESEMERFFAWRLDEIKKERENNN